MPGPARIIALLAVATTAQPKIWRDLKERNERHMKQGRAARARPDHPRVAVHHSILRGSAQLTPRRNQDEQLPYLHYRKHELDYATHHAYVDLNRKLLYCAIPKVACTEFFRLFHRMMDAKKTNLRERERWRGDPHFRPDKPVLNKLADEATATHAMNDPNFTKFVFFRDPAERLLSAYLDKFEHGARYRVGYGLRIFKDAQMNFTGFIERIERDNKRRANPDGLHPHTNPHWRPQRFMCNLEKFLPLYNFVGSFAHLKEHAEALLRQAGLWEEFGARGWALKKGGGRGWSAGRVGTPSPGAEGAMFQKNTAWHADGAGTKKERYYTPELLARVKKAYAMDYEMFDSIGALGLAPTTGAPWARQLPSKQKLWQFDRGFLDPDLRPPDAPLDAP